MSSGDVLNPGRTLSQRAVRGGVWMLGLRALERLLGLVRTIVLARLLSPDDFGVMGVALLTTSALETFTRTGFDIALIQERDDIRPYLDTAWTVHALRGFLLFGAVYAAAPLVSGFFASPEALAVVRWVSVVELLKGLTNISVIYFQRDLKFNRVFAYQLIGTASNLITAIVAALIWGSVWALVLGLVIGQLSRCALSYLMHPYRPRFLIDRDKARRMQSFGKWVFATNVVVFLAVNGDDALLGKLLGTRTLGLYQMAFVLANLATTEITRVISEVALPAYAQLRDSLQRLRSSYLKTVEFSAFITVPVAVWTLTLGPDFTGIFLGEDWMPMVSGLQILSVSGLVRSMVATGGPLFNASSKPELDFGMNLVRLLVMGATVLPLTREWGLAGASTAVLLGISAAIPFWLHGVKRIAGLELRALLPSFLQMVLISAAIACPVLVIKLFTVSVRIPEFALLVAASTLGYLAVSWLLWKRLGRGPIPAIHEILRALVQRRHDKDKRSIS